MASTKTRAPKKQTRRGPSILGVLGVLLIVGGLASLGWVAWQYFGTNITSRQAFDDEATQLRDKWTEPAADETQIPGEALGLLRIPDFGDDYEVPVMIGIDDDTLKRGVGMYPTAAQPGEVGNFSVAGHRVTHGEPFRRLLELDKGAEIIIETRDAIYTYSLDTKPAELTVADTESWVLDPVPGKPDQTPTQALITLTTCQDLFRSPDRSVAFGHLISTQPK